MDRAFGYASRADAALGVADDAVSNKHISGRVEIARRIDDARVGQKDRAAVGEHQSSFSESISTQTMAAKSKAQGTRRNPTKSLNTEKTQ